MPLAEDDRMWRKGVRVVVKLMCLLFMLGAYQFWKHSWSEETAEPRTYRQHQGMTLGKADAQSVPITKIGDSSLLQNDNEISSLSNANNDGKVTWISPNPYASSRHLLSPPPTCTPRAVDHFPWDYLTPQQRKNGLIVLHCLLALYMFLALSIVCDRYFVPSLEVLCELMNIETDIAGATFMAAGSSAPELATAVIGVFVAKADVGLGTVVGSAIYNVMFVIGMCALVATSAVHLHWWPMLRDSLAYLLSVFALVLIIHDSVIRWYESVALIVLYVLYVVFMFFNGRLELWCVPRVNRYKCCSHATRTESETMALRESENSAGCERADNVPVTHAHQEAETWHKLCERPEGCVWTVLWVLAMPLSIVMFLTVPDCRRPGLRKWFWATFLLSLVWLSVFCFIMVWMITVVGFTANIPDSVMSLTFIAFGVSLPDVVASILVVRDGLGDMAVSNAIGSNVFDILVCLGVPWFLQTCVKSPGSEIPVYSEGLEYSSIMLLSTVAFLLIATHLNGWRLTKKYGVLLLIVYLIYVVLASLYELNVFGYFHPPECPSSY